MSNVLNALGYSRFLERRERFTMNYSEIGSTFDDDIYSVLKSRQKFKIVEDVIFDIGSKFSEDKKPLEVKDIIIKDMKLMNKTEKLEEKLGKKEEKVEDKKEEKVEDKNDLTEPKKNLIDENEKDFLFGSKPKKVPEEAKISNEATFQNETKEILQEDKNKKKIVITEDALEPPKEKSPRKKK